MKNMGLSCKMCGQCCRFEIPLTLLDLHRMAAYLKVSDQKVFDEYVQESVSSLSSLFMIRKNKQGICLFLNADNKCAIHAAKPRACEFFACSLHAAEKIMPWTAACTDTSQYAKLWEQSVAAEITKVYIKKNSTTWNDIDYHRAIKSIFDNIVVRDTQKLKVGRDREGRPLNMIYDCTLCKKRGTYALETPVTLDDIRRMASHLGLAWPAFFNSYIAPEASSNSGCLKLIRHEHCIFFRQEKHCTVKDVRPMHCRFTPCPKRTGSVDVMDALFLGSGTVKMQFRHQAAMAVTRQYVAECGIKYNKRSVKRHLRKMDGLVNNHKKLFDFCQKIAPYRYIDDTIGLLKDWDKGTETERSLSKGWI